MNMETEQMPRSSSEMTPEQLKARNAKYARRYRAKQKKKKRAAAAAKAAKAEMTHPAIVKAPTVAPVVVERGGNLDAMIADTQHKIALRAQALVVSTITDISPDEMAKQFATDAETTALITLLNTLRKAKDLAGRVAAGSYAAADPKKRSPARTGAAA